MSKKSVLMAFSFLIVSLLVINVSAGWIKDLFTFGDESDEEGELAAAKNANAKVEITAANVPPQIVYVSNVLGVDLLEGRTRIVSFNFTACSVNGRNYLPTVAAGIFGSINLSSVNSGAGVCGYTVDTTFSGFSPSDACRNYTCNVTAYYYFDPTPSLWTINATIRDPNSGLYASNFSGRVGFNPLKAWDMDRPEINFTGVQINSPTGKLNDPPNIKVNNTGNVDIDGITNILRINATELKGETNPTHIITGGNFTAGRPILTTNPCSGSSLVHTQWATISGFTILHSASSPAGAASTDLQFCIKTITGVIPQNYSTDPLKKWQIEGYFP